MKERPILFSAPMVRAILEGRKTQTRRVLHLPAGWNLKSHDGNPYTLGTITSSHPKKGKFGAFIRQEIHPGCGKFMTDLLVCPYGNTGDRLWVRETFAWSRYAADQEEILWRADADYSLDDRGGARWRPSIHMPRWASRITLEITDIRVERLNKISEADALAEGIQKYKGPLRWVRYISAVTGEANFNSARDAFASLWESINGAGSWEQNPWVWVVEFRRVVPEQQRDSDPSEDLE